MILALVLLDIGSESNSVASPTPAVQSRIITRKMWEKHGNHVEALEIETRKDDELNVENQLSLLINQSILEHGPKQLNQDP